LAFQPILNQFRRFSEYSVVDLSSRTLKKQKIDPSQFNDLNNYFDSLKHKNNARVLYGGYLEKRSLYNTKSLFQGQSKLRNIHLGIDFWADAYQEVVCPLDGIIHSFKNNNSKGDYGPCIILKHNNFYTLYGHLSNDSLINLSINQTIRRNQVFCKLGSIEENGGYLPHLHFQVIKNIENYYGDYPGVCDEGSLKYYKTNTIDPKIILDL